MGLYFLSLMARRVSVRGSRRQVFAGRHQCRLLFYFSARATCTMISSIACSNRCNLGLDHPSLGNVYISQKEAKRLFKKCPTGPKHHTKSGLTASSFTKTRLLNILKRIGIIQFQHNFYKSLKSRVFSITAAQFTHQLYFHWDSRNVFQKHFFMSIPLTKHVFWKIKKHQSGNRTGRVVSKAKSVAMKRRSRGTARFFKKYEKY